jgi:hypothetical protein
MDYRKLKDLNKLEGNPRIIKDDDFQKLCTSIKANPDYFEARPLILSNRTGQLVIIAGNQRYEAAKHLGLKEVPTYLIEGLTEEREREIIIRDNVNNGQWDWEQLANTWSAEELKDWGVDVPVFEGMEGYGEDFSLPDGDKAPFQQMTFTLADEQATEIKNAIEDIKGTDDYKYMETSGNENSNGNALYLIVAQWAEQKK